MCPLGCLTGPFGVVFWPVDHFVGLCCQPLKGQSEVSCWVGQSSDHSGRASEGKSKLWLQLLLRYLLNFYFFGPETDCVESFPPFFKSVATIGSSLTSVQHDVRTMQAALESQKKDDDSKKITVNSRQWGFKSVFFFFILAVVMVTGQLENICGVNLKPRPKAFTNSLMVFPSRRAYVGQAFRCKGLIVSWMHTLGFHS